MEKRYYFADVHVHGYYPNHILKYWRRKEIKVDVTEEDLADLTDGTVDYIGFHIICHLRLMHTVITIHTLII